MDDIVPLSERLTILQLVRVLIATIVTIYAFSSPESFAVPSGRVLTASALFVVVSLALEWARRRLLPHTQMLLAAAILLDGVYLVLTVLWTGEVVSTLLPACYLMLVAVTMLLSYRTGLKMALWYSLLFCAGDALAGAWIPTLTGGAAPLSRVAATVATFMLFSISTALFSSFNERALRRSRYHFRALADLGIALELEVQEPKICCVLAERTVQDLGFSRAAVLSIDLRRAVGAVRSATGTTMLELPSPLVETGVSADAMSSHHMILRDISEQEDPDPLVDLVLPFAGRVVAVPLRADAENVGILLAEWPRQSRPPRSTTDALSQVAVHGALALRNGRLLGELDRLAARDPLTGLGNRRSFNEVLEREISRARRDDTRLSLAMFDVDHFKNVNDQHGHQRGDQVLRAVARALAAGVRGADLASRYGGEEFVVLLPGASGEDACATADRLRVDVQQGPSPVPVTVSAGIATFPDQATTGAQLLAMADKALYEAKRQGRNRAVIATDDQPADGSDRTGATLHESRRAI